MIFLCLCLDFAAGYHLKSADVLGMTAHYNIKEHEDALRNYIDNKEDKQ